MKNTSNYRHTWYRDYDFIRDLISIEHSSWDQDERIRAVTPGGCRYFITMMDDFTQYAFVNFLKKSTVPQRVKEYVRRNV